MLKVDRNQNLIADGIILFLAVLIFYYGITTVGFTYFSTNVLYDLVKNWKTRPLIDIKLGNGICPLSYEPILKDVWPGTVIGCDCSGTLFGSLKTGKCKSKGDAWCSNVSPIPPLELNLWEGTLICGKRHPKNYLYFLKQKIFGGCPLGMKLCGKLDNKNKDYCVNNDEQCLINKILIQNTSTNSALSLQLGYGKFLTFSTSTNDPSIPVQIQLKSSEGQVCLDPNQINSHGKPYLLMNSNTYSYFCTNSLDQSFYDDRYKQIDQSTVGEFYDDNKLSQILHLLPQYQFTNTEQLNLYSRGYLGWSESCLNDPELSPENLILSSEKLPKLLTLQTVVYYFSIIYLPFMIILFLTKLCTVFYENDNRTASSNLQRCEAVNFIFLLLGAVACIVTFSNGNSLGNFFVALKQSNCGDHYTDEALFSLGDNLHSNISKNKTSMIFYMLTLLVIICNMAIMQFKASDIDLISEDANNYVEMDANIVKIEEEKKEKSN
jgi:hypothetical protein